MYIWGRGGIIAGDRHILRNGSKGMLKKVLKNILIIVAGVWASTAFASSASLYYSDGPWMGKVIDTETKEPIGGAVVLAVWQKVYASPTGRDHYFFDAIEVLTGNDGRFFIPKFNAVNFFPIIRSIEGPDFTIFKPGYTPFGGYYDYFHKYFPKSPLKVDRTTQAELFKKGITIELLRLKTREERLSAISGAEPLTGVPYDKIPILVKLINLEARNLGLDPIPLKGGK